MTNSRANANIVIESKYMLRRVIPKAASHSLPNDIDAIKTHIRAKICSGDIDVAVMDTVTYIKATAKTPAEKTKLQDIFNSVGMACSSYPFCDELASSIELQRFKPDNTLPLFAPNTEPDVTLHAATYFDTSTHTNFNKTDMDEIISTTSTKVSADVKAAIRGIAHLSGKVLNARGEYTGSCLRLSEDLVIMPLHCIKDIKDGKIQFLTPDLQGGRIVDIAASDIEAYENADIAVVRLRQKQEPVSIKFYDTILEGEQLFLLHRPDGRENDVLQVSSNVAQLATWDGYSVVTSHDSSHGSSGGIYINTRGEVVALHMGASTLALMMFSVQKYAYLFAGVVLSIDADSKIYDFLELERAKDKKREQVALKTVVTLDTKNMISLPTIDASQHSTPGAALTATTKSLRQFYNDAPTREFCQVQINNMPCILQSGETITLNFAIVAKASDKYLYGIEMNVVMADGTDIGILKIGDSLSGYNQVTRVEYPKDAAKFLWINSHMFAPDLLGELVVKLFQSHANPECQQEVFDYCIQLLEIAKMPIVERLTEKIVQFEQKYGVAMSDVLKNPAPYGVHADLFRKIAFTLGRVKLNHSKLSKLFSQTPPINLSGIMAGLNRELDNAKSSREFIYDMLLPALRLLNIIGETRYDELLDGRESISDDEILILYTTHEQNIRDLFTPEILTV